MTIKMEIEITGWEIQKDTQGKYMFNTPDMRTFIHCDKLELSGGGLTLRHKDEDGYFLRIGRIWLNSNKEDIDKIKELIEA